LTQESGYALDRANETHRDQCLAAFAEFGIPLSQTIDSDSTVYEVRDVLADSIAEFNLKQQEASWTAIAYALYLPPISRWLNRYGEAYSFDDLTTNLLDRPLDESSCGGAHILEALTIILRADRREPILSVSTSKRLKDRLKAVVQVVTETQSADGSWSLGWAMKLREAEPRRGYGHWSPDDTPESRLLITGHMVEWFSYLPDDVSVDVGTIHSGIKWLDRRLGSVTTEELATAESLCPYVHAAIAVKYYHGFTESM
jgi:hypothetical protein